MRHHARSVIAGTAIALGALLLLAGALLTDASRLLRPAVFADRVAASLADPRVADYAAAQLTDGLLTQRRDLVAFRPLLLAASRDVVRSDAFRGLLRGTARRAHAAVFSGLGRGMVLSMPDLPVVLQGALAGVPALAQAVPADVQLAVSDLATQPALHRAVRTMRVGATLAGYAPWVLAGGIALLLAGIWVMADRRDALVGAGGALVVVAAALTALTPTGRLVVGTLADDPDIAGALQGLWNVALAGLPVWALTYAGVGIALAAAGSSLLARLDAEELLADLRMLLVAPPRHARWRVVRALGLLGLGLWGVLAPRAALNALTVLAGLLTAFVGLRELFAVVLLAAHAPLPFRHAVAESREGLAVGGALVVLLAGAFAAGVLLLGRPAAEARVPTTIVACNGAAALCDRRVDEVTFVGTHNAMAAADLPDWLFPQQERSIAGQLDDGVRALLLDVHYGTPVGTAVRTDLPRERGDQLANARRALGDAGFAAAMRIRDRLTDGTPGTPGLYLCHGFCELGARPLDAALRGLREFLVAHPGEVLLLVLEDYVTPQDLAAAFERSGLARLAYRGPTGPWPTLRELVARDERVIVLVESGRPGVPWLHPAFAAMQETPYTFRDARDTLSCAPNRGGTGGSLFQLNHWIETTPTPRPSNAAIVNAADYLLARVDRCARARGRRPNVLAVDWYRTGDVLRVARALNGLGPRDARR